MRFLADLCNHPHVASVLLAMHKVCVRNGRTHIHGCVHFIHICMTYICMVHGTHGDDTDIEHPYASIKTQDVAADTLMHQVRRQCTSWVELNPCTLAEQRWAAANGTIVHGKITARHKRAAGMRLVCNCNVRIVFCEVQHQVVRCMCPVLL